MTNSDQEELERLRRERAITLDHLVAYKGLYHDAQDKMLDAMNLAAERSRTIKRQREIIADLEKRLGLDEEL
jgi:hypothetical protein